MALQTSSAGLSPSEAYRAIRDIANGTKSGAQSALAACQAGNVSTDYIFGILDNARAFISQINTWKAVAGLDTFATGQGYTGTMSADATTAVNSCQTIINWVVTNFPTNTGTTPLYLLGHTLNADGTRSPRQFTPAQTAGLQTNLQNFIATIS